MGIIETTYDLPKDLTIIKAVGKMKPDDFHEWTARYYAGTVTLHSLWDLTQADLSDISTDDIRYDALQTKYLAIRRKGGKTAIVAGNAFEYGLSRMLETFYDLQEMPFDVQAFRTIDHARDWLGV